MLEAVVCCDIRAAPWLALWGAACIGEVATMIERVVIVGTGAQAKYAMETFTLNGIAVAGVVRLDDTAASPDWCAAYGVIDLGPLCDDMHPIFDEVGSFIVCCADASAKARLHRAIAARGLNAVSALHPAARIATTAVVGAGSIVNAGAVVQPFARIGIGSMIHANVVIEHDCQLGDFVNLAPGVRLAGWVAVGVGAVVYTGANVIPQRTIGAGSIVAAGATVIEDVPPGCTVVGVPARIKRQLSQP